MCTIDNTERLCRLEERMRRLEDVQEICALKATYSRCCDTGWNGAGSDADAAASLFTATAVYDTPMTGQIEGRDAIRDMFQRFGLGFQLALHIIGNPHVVVDGDQAIGTWTGLNALLSADGQALWSGGIYQDEFTRTPEGWRFQLVRRRSAFLTSFDDGWGRVRDLAASVGGRHPPGSARCSTSTPT